MEWKAISISEPANPQTGLLWIRPGDGVTVANSAFLRLGDSWLELGTNDTIPFTPDNTTILINGKKVLFQKGALTIDDILTNQVDTCAFTLELAGDDQPTQGQEVIIYYKQFQNSTPAIRFGGIISAAPQKRIAMHQYAYDVTVVDYSDYLRRKTFTGVYVGQTEGYIIRDILAQCAPEIGWGIFVDEGLTVDYISFNAQYPIDCLKKLCTTGKDWYVDYEKNLHYFEVTDNVAPYALTDNPLGGQYHDLVFDIDKSQLGNLITVRGGSELSGVYLDDVQKAIAGQTVFNTKYFPYAPDGGVVCIYINSVQKTLGIENADTGGFDFVMNLSEKVVKCLDFPALNANDVVQITYSYKIPIYVQRSDSASIAAVQAIEGGLGIYERPQIVDDTLASRQAAVDRAMAELSDYSNPIVTGSFVTNQYGYRSGQVLSIAIPSRNINTQVYIQEVSASSLGGGLFEYTVTFATKLKGLTQYLLELYDRGVTLFTRTDEVLSVARTMTQEVMLMVETIPAIIIKDTSAGKYKYSADDGSTVGKGRYNLSSWG